MSTLGGARWQAANAELDRALDLSGEERLAWLRSLRARDVGLAADVQTLLDEHEALKAARFLEEAPGTLPITRTGQAAGEPTGPRGPALANGAVFGAYQIIRPLGHGGMGAVYEADEIDSGRRVALKVLAGPRQDERERERFLREGRLAASVNHPHCVFVFGASEIDGHPVIAMEVMRATLADRSKSGGPFEPAAAVDAILQLIAGLQAAAAAGILHRDVKPSNCFIDAEGVVKIGDFGISRSQRPSEETALSTRGRPAATPAYASPEQLRGAALDVRSDIYSLGATLYELLTGRRPFEAADLMALLMAVANDAPSPPHVIAPAVPKGLSAVVLRCLAKRPDERFSDYDALAAALEPYATTASTPATLGRRFLAGVIDNALLSLASVPITLWWGLNWLALVPLLIMSAVEVLYYAVCETRWAATPGKAISGVVIVQQGGAPARASQALVRAIVYVLVPAWPILALLLFGLAKPDALQLAVGRTEFPTAPAGRLTASPESLQLFLSAVGLLMVAVLFSTARRRNGYAALHDLVSGTRVVERRVRTIRRPFSAVTAEAPRNVVARLGPFAVLGDSVPGLPDGWRPGFDDRLRRPVWIREVPPGTPPISPARRAINRTTRLRWLAGRRDAQEAWDVFEAVHGVPVDRVAIVKGSWPKARWWLLDLARECSAQSADDRPPRRRDRVWILDAGGAKLVDDPALDQAADAAFPERPVAPFLLDVVSAVRGSVDEPPNSRSASPWPMRVHEFFERLTAEPDLSCKSIADTLDAFTRQRAELTRGWRSWSMAIPMLFPILWALGTLALSSAFAIMTSADGPIPDDVRIAARLLRELDRARFEAFPLPAQDRAAIELALASRYREALKDDRAFGVAPSLTGRIQRRRMLAGDVLQRHEQTIAVPDAPKNAAVETLVKQVMAARRDPPWYLPIAIGAGAFVMALFCVAAAALVGALLFRGSGMRLLGLEVVTADGRPASRLRILARTALTWAPVLLVLLITISAIAIGEIEVSAGIRPQADLSRGAEPRITVSSGAFELGQGLGYSLGSVARATRTGFLLWLTPTLLLVMLAGAVVAIVHPARGIQDRLAGTWIVPR